MTLSGELHVALSFLIFLTRDDRRYSWAVQLEPLSTGSSWSVRGISILTASFLCRAKTMSDRNQKQSALWVPSWDSSCSSLFQYCTKHFPVLHKQPLGGFLNSSNLSLPPQSCWELEGGRG